MFTVYASHLDLPMHVCVSRHISDILFQNPFLSFFLSSLSFSLRSVKPKKTLAEALSALVPITPLRNRSFSPLDEDNLILSPACTPAAKEVRFSFSDSICRSTFKRRYLCRVAAYRSCWDRRLHGVHVYGVVLVALLDGSPHEF